MLSRLVSARGALERRDGDGLVLEDGSIVRVAGKPESLVEVAAASDHGKYRHSSGAAARSLATVIISSLH